MIFKIVYIIILESTERTMKKNHSKYEYHAATMAGKYKLTLQH